MIYSKFNYNILMQNLKKLIYNKLTFISLGVLWSTFCIYFIFQSLKLDLPINQHDIRFYFKENGRDLKYLSCRLLNNAKKSIYLQSFGFSDPDLINILNLKSNESRIDIRLDKKDINPLIKSPNINFHPYRNKGIMHRKIIAIDQAFIFLGSTNLTTTGLKIHKNHWVCIKSSPLYMAIEQNKMYEEKNLSYYPIPECKKKALQTLKNRLDSAKNKISIAMYAFSNKEIAEKLICAKRRGVDVEVFLDKSLSRSISKGIKTTLIKHKIPVYTNLSNSLLHHKCALVDHSFVFGSANWTEAGFNKNDEYLVIIDALDKKQTKEIQKFFKKIRNSSLLITK
jgi:phosphatidylserine/phosphatidylglycerophosphate/cardiolipin synthase-like enzyme